MGLCLGPLLSGDSKEDLQQLGPGVGQTGSVLELGSSSTLKCVLRGNFQSSKGLGLHQEFSKVSTEASLVSIKRWLQAGQQG